MQEAGRGPGAGAVAIIAGAVAVIAWLLVIVALLLRGASLPRTLGFRVINLIGACLFGVVWGLVHLIGRPRTGPGH